MPENAKTSYVSRARNAWLNKTESTYWFGIGRTAAWTDENDPPTVPDDYTAIDTPIVYVKASLVKLAKIVVSGEDIIHNGVKYAWVADEDALTELARFLYCYCELTPGVGGQPYGTFRQTALYTDLVPATGHESDLWLAPANVEDVGNICYLANHIAVVLVESVTRAVPVMREFR